MGPAGRVSNGKKQRVGTGIIRRRQAGQAHTVVFRWWKMQAEEEVGDAVTLSSFLRALGTREDLEFSCKKGTTL